MKIDLLSVGDINRDNGGQHTYQLERGRITAVLFTISSSFHLRDEITIKLRHAGGVTLIADRVSAGMLATLCDLKFGRPTTGTPDTEPGDDNPGDVQVGVRTSPKVLNAFLLPLGHLTLLMGQLEITFRGIKGVGGAGFVKFYAVTGDMSTDVLYQYDANYDLEGNHNLVREIYLCSKGQESATPGDYSFFKYANNGAATNGAAAGVAKDINVLVDAEGEYYQNDIDGAGAMTSITGELSNAPNILLRLYADGDLLPTPQVRVKITGADKDMAYLLIIKEIRIAQMALASNVANAQKQIERTQSLEKSSPETAQAARAAGVTDTSANLVQAAATLPQPATATK